MHLGQVIQEARTRTELTIRELGRRSGLSAALISRVERGEVVRPGAEKLIRLSTALDRDPELLLLAAGRIHPPSLGKTAAWLLGVYGGLKPLPDASDPELGSAWQALDDARKCAKKLEEEEIFRVPRIDDALAERGRLIVEHRDAQCEIDNFNDFAFGRDLSQMPEREESARRAVAREEALNRKLNELEREIAEHTTWAHIHQAQRDEAEEHLEQVLRDYASRLFIRVPAGALPPLADFPYVTRPQVAETAEEMLIKQDLELLAQRTRMTFEVTRLGLLQYPDDRDFRQIARVWDQLSPERRRRACAFVNDQARLSSLDQLNELEEEVIEQADTELSEDEAQ